MNDRADVVVNDMAHSFFTIGHSTRPIEVFVDLLRQAKVQLVVDVRTVPRSRTNPSTTTTSYPRHCPRSKSTTSTSLHLEGCEAILGRSRQVGKRLLGEPKLSQLRRLRHDRRLPRRSCRAAGPGTCATLRCHVRGSRMVAMSSAHHRGLPDRLWRDSVSYPARGPYRGGSTDRSSSARTSGKR